MVRKIAMVAVFSQFSGRLRVRHRVKGEPGKLFIK